MLLVLRYLIGIIGLATNHRDDVAGMLAELDAHWEAQPASPAVLEQREAVGVLAWEACCQRPMDGEALYQHEPPHQPEQLRRLLTCLPREGAPADTRQCRKDRIWVKRTYRRDLR